MLIPVMAQKSKQITTTGNSVFRFVINKGEFFSASSPGEVSELSLVGYFTKNGAEEGQMNPSVSANSTTLTGLAVINSYSKLLQTKVVASLPISTISSPTGLFLSLVVDGRPLSVQLPYVNETDTWPAGYAYTYNITVEGNSLIISGVTTVALSATREVVE